MSIIDLQTNRHKVLIVDDETINIKMMLNDLKDDYKTLVATNGIKALSIVRSNNPPDLILLDISMPEMDGYEVCRQIKQDDKLQNIPIIFVSANSLEEEQIKGLQLGAVDYLTKPICLPILKEKIKSHLEMKQHRDFMELLLDRQYREMEHSTSLNEKDRLQQQDSIQQYIEEVHENQERLKLSLWGSGDEFWNWNLQTGEYLRENPLPIDFPKSIVWDSIEAFKSFVHDEDFEELKQRFFDHLNDKTEFFEVNYRAKNRDNNWLWLMQRGKIVKRDTEGSPVSLSGTIKNISHFKQTEQELLLAAKSFENISDAVWVCDKSWKILKINNAFKEITGFEPNDVLGKSLLTLMGNDYGEVLKEFNNELPVISINKERWRREAWAIQKNGNHFPQELHISVLREQNKVVTHFIGAFSDITYRKNAEDKLRYLANYDSLTGLPNRTLFMERLQHAIDIARRKKYQMAVLFLDLDKFKNINDTLGHTSGDVVLKEIGRRINNSIRDIDTAARLGGDEFTVLLEQINNNDEISLITDRILRDIAKPLNVAGCEINISASIGVSVYPDYGSNYKDLLRHADIAMYHAKTQGRNNVQFYANEMDQRSVFRLELEQQLHNLVEDDQLLLHYQPKTDLSTGEIHGLEVLVRWLHPKHGLIPPDMFISMAEESGHIVKIGEAILRKACIEAKNWWDTKKINGRLAVNLSPVQIAQENLPLVFENILQETGFLAEHLELEITESTMMENKELAVRHMMKFKEMGIHLSIDDFGTGYSSLSSIKHLPVNTLKIDRSFINDISNSLKDKGIVASIISLAHHLNLKVIAEGVETEEQKNMLIELSCEEMQGFLFSKPLPHNEIEELLKAK